MDTWVPGLYYQSQLVYLLGSTFPWSGRWEEGMVYNERSAQWSLFSFVCCQARSQPSSPVSLVLGVSGGVLLRGTVNLQVPHSSHSEAACGTSQKSCRGNPYYCVGRLSEFKVKNLQHGLLTCLLRDGDPECQERN